MLLAHSCASFSKYCVEGIQPNREQIERNVEKFLDAGDRAERTDRLRQRGQGRKKAHKENISLREAAIALKLLSGEEFDRLVRPEKMLAPEG